VSGKEGNNGTHVALSIMCLETIGKSVKENLGNYSPKGKEERHPRVIGEVSVNVTKGRLKGLTSAIGETPLI